LYEYTNEGIKFFLFTDISDKSKLEEIRQNLEIAEDDNFKIISIAAKNKFIWNFWSLPKYLRKNPVDVYLTQYITPFFVPKKIKIVTIIHDISFNFFPQFIKKTDLFFLKTLIPLSVKRADLILGVSEFTENEIIKFYKVSKDKVDFFHNAVSEEFKAQDVSREKKDEARKKYGLPEKYILYLGTLQPRKNIPLLVESYAKIKEKIPQVKLVLAGSRQAHNFDWRIDRMIEKYGLEKDVVFSGFVDEKDKAVLYKAAHVFAFPSFYEGFGIPVLESFIVGTPVLASDIPSLREVGGDGALFADPLDIDKFSETLYSICIEENLRSRLVDSGKRRAELFLWKNSAKKILEIFNGFL